MSADELQHTIVECPGGNSPKRVLIFSPHPDDDVITMGGTLRRLVQHGHGVHVVYQTSGNIAVSDEELCRYLHIAPGTNRLPSSLSLAVKTLIRRTEARAACSFNGLPCENVHFLDMPFYETGEIAKRPLCEEDIILVLEVLRRIQPHLLFFAGDLADPHGTHRLCTEAVLTAVEREREAGAAWLRDCQMWMYRGAWEEWKVEDIEMVVPLSAEELLMKREAILKHQSQSRSAMFLGSDARPFWQRAEERNRATAALYRRLGLPAHEAMEAFAAYGNS